MLFFLTMNNLRSDSLQRSSSPIQIRRQSYRSCLAKKERNTTTFVFQVELRLGPQLECGQILESR